MRVDQIAGLAVLGLVLLALIINSLPENPSSDSRLVRTDSPTATIAKQPASTRNLTPPRRSPLPARATSTPTQYMPATQPSVASPTPTLEPTETKVRQAPDTPTIRMAIATSTLVPTQANLAPTNTAVPSPSTATEAPPATSTTENSPYLHIIETSCKTRPEWVAIKNDGVTDQDLSGWQLHDERDNPVPYVFPDGYRLPVGYEVKVWSYGIGPGSEFDLDWTSRPVWNNDGDVIFLRDHSGRLVAERSC